MDEIRRVAIECVGRAVLFGSLGICCVMLGFSFAPVSAFRSGAFLTLLMSMVLVWNAMAVGRRNPKHSEVWLYLDEKTRPAEGHARVVFATIMREVYARFAQISFGVAIGMFVIAFLLTLAGLEPYQVPASAG